MAVHNSQTGVTQDSIRTSSGLQERIRAKQARVKLTPGR